MDNNKNNDVKIISDIEEIKEMFGNTSSNIGDDSKDMKFLDTAMKIFFKFKDDYGLSKTDIERHIIIPFSMLLDFAENPLPLYNEYLKENKKEEIKLIILVSFLTEKYIKILVSKNREGRSEGTEISKSILEIARNKIHGMGLMKEDNDDKMISDLSK